MQVALVLGGAVLLLVTFLDAITTTLAAGAGGGPITRRVCSASVRLTRHAKAARLRPGVLAYTGPAVVLATGGLWVLGIWAGWTMIFASSPEAVVDAQTNMPATLADRVYYVGFVIFTLGVGDFVPGPGVWRIVTSIATFGGLFLITLAITYLLSVVSAAVGRRHLAESIHLLGSSGSEVAASFWNGREIGSDLAVHVSTLSAQIVRVAQQHLAYPVLHSFHTRDRRASAPYAIAILDEALLLLSVGVGEDVRPDNRRLHPLRRAIEHYVDTVSASVKDRDGAPPLPPLSQLASTGVPVVPDEVFTLSAQDHEPRRRQLHALVRSDCWSWPDR